MPKIPPSREPAARAVSDENLRGAAANCSQEVLFGLALLAEAGSPVRKELFDRRELADATVYTAAMAVMTLVLDRVDVEAVDRLVERDEQNALGYYLRGTLFQHADRDQEAIVAYRQAATCRQIELYQALASTALASAVNFLNLAGADRLCALSWMATRLSNFSGLAIQPMYWALREIGRSGEGSNGEEASEILLRLGGHLYATNFQNRWYAERAIQEALALKAEAAAATDIPKMYGYAAIVHALNNAHFAIPGFEDDERPVNILELARFLPDRIHRAFVAADPALLNAGTLGEANLHPPREDQPAFDRAKENFTLAAKELLEEALLDPDGIAGAYLKGIPSPNAEERPNPWSLFCTPVGTLMMKRPELFRAASNYERAMNALWKAGQNDPWHKNMSRIMKIGWEVIGYAQKHDGNYPSAIDVVMEKPQEPPEERKSFLSGREYVYVGAGEKMPAKSKDQAEFVVFYDDQAGECGLHPCFFANGVGGGIRVEDLREQLRKRGRR